MKVVIIGGGEVGFHVARALSEEDYDITVIDIDPSKCKRASESIDVIVVNGNGASPETLLKADIGNANYVVCCTRIDEVNLIAAQQAHDTYSSKVLSNELVEVRKVNKIMTNAKMGLERIELRLTTFHDLGDTVTTLMPTIGLMNGLKSSLVKFMPGADQEIGRMTEMLGGLMTETFSSSGSSFGVEESTNAESDSILAEAAAVAESQSGEQFPSVPSTGMEQFDIPTSESKFM